MAGTKADKKKRPSHSLYLLLLALVIILFISGRTSLVITLVLIFISIIVSLYRYFIPFDIGLEFLTFTTVVLSIGVSPFVGFIAAIIIILFSHIATQNICVFIPIKIVAYGAIAFLSLAMKGMAITHVGIILTVIKIIILGMVTFMLNPGRVMTDIPSNVLNLLINIYFFTAFGGMVLGLLD